MRIRMILALVVLLLAGSVWWWAGRRKAAAAGEGEPLAQRNQVELTVYAQDFAMARETRPVRLAQGENQLRVPDVSRLLDPQSVMLEWSGAGGAPRVIAQAYDLGVANGEAVLHRYLGREVEVVRYGQDGREADRMKGRLMAASEGGLLLKSEGRFYVNPPGTVVAQAEKDIVTIPQLSVQADSPAAQSANLEVSYLTRGLAWSADYVARLSPDGASLALECHATVTNRTGVSYPNATVTLIAGTPNRAATSAPVPSAPARAGEMAEYEGRGLRRLKREGSGGMASEAVGEFHAYKISKPTTVAQEQMNRLMVLSSEQVPVQRDYSARLPALSAWDYGYYGGGSDQPQRGNVAVALTFFNRARDGLGAPLPHGDIRLYEPDRAGTMRYAGAAAILDTPEDQKIVVTLANAFDLFTETRIVRRQKIDRRTVRKEVEVVLHNAKTTPVDLRLVQDFSGRWKIVGESHKHIGLNAAQAQWTVPVPSGGTTTLRYTVNLGM